MPGFSPPFYESIYAVKGICGRQQTGATRTMAARDLRRPTNRAFTDQFGERAAIDAADYTSATLLALVRSGGGFSRAERRRRRPTRFTRSVSSEQRSRTCQ